MAIINYTQDEMADARASEAKFSILPKGVYNAWIEKIEDRVSKSGTQYISIMVSVDVDGRSRKVFDSWYLESEKARKIGLARMGELMSILGMENDGSVDTQKFVGMDVRVRIGVRKDDSGDERNVVNEYLACGSAKPVGTIDDDDDNVPF